MITRLHFPEAKDIIGIATEAGRDAKGSEDLVFLDGRIWSDEIQKHAKRIEDELQKAGLFGERRWHQTVENEFPDTQSLTRDSQALSNMKGRDRNRSCPCGSGKKAKKCCG